MNYKIIKDCGGYTLLDENDNIIYKNNLVENVLSKFNELPDSAITFIDKTEETTSYKEILRLRDMLAASGIPHTFERFMDGFRICYPTDDEESLIMDAIEHYFSYGHKSDLLEIYGLLTPEEEKEDTVLGYLTAEEVFERINKHYSEVLSGNNSD